MSLTIPSRRRFLFGAGALLAAPAIVRVASLMPLSVIKPVPLVDEFTMADLTMSIEKWSAAYLRPMMLRLARDMDARVYAELWETDALHIP